MVVKRVAVIGAGPAGAIAIDALAQEKAFDVIRVFERREAAGGCWIDDKAPPPHLTELPALASRSADKPLPVPSVLPAQTPRAPQPRYAESSVYPYLETNVEAVPMEFSQEPIPGDKSELSVSLHGPDTPFRHYGVMQRYVQGLVERNGYRDFVEYNTAVERVEKVGAEWKVTLRKSGERLDYWWAEWFDAVVVATGHYWVPYVPHVDGLEEFEKSRPGSVLHSKQFRGRDAFKNKRVVVVGASVSAADIAVDLTKSAALPIHAVVLGHTVNAYFGDEAFNHPSIIKRPSIARVDAATRTVHFVDGTSVASVDHLIFGTGYTWTQPFLQPLVPVRQNRVPGLYQHVVWRDDPTLVFVGAVGAGLTFKVFEWQAVYAARLLAGRGALPPAAERERWETERVARRGDGPKFTLIFPDFEEYFETLRGLAGPPTGDGKGRALPPFDKAWVDRFMGGHERRKAMWRRLNAEARKKIAGGDTSSQERAKL